MITIQFAYRNVADHFAEMTVDGKKEKHRIIEREVTLGEPPEEWGRYLIKCTRATELMNKATGQPLMDTGEVSFEADSIEEALKMVPGLFANWAKDSKNRCLSAAMSLPAPGFDPKTMIQNGRRV